MQIEERTDDGLTTVTCALPKPAVFCKDDMHELSQKELAMAPGWSPNLMDELSDDRYDLSAFEPTITLHSTGMRRGRGYVYVMRTLTHVNRPARR